ncbi:SMP-30/gluconolactonase/LRE family protein [Streptomyces sp. CHD11]|uniref:SMP-30/gluconolactonase/LRE family protein n=1 Tax=Streptomyces sp. CHD11 TaxID=2741325 RepID=UPI001BFC6B01|nr:SMP-30/gluconolactonase/LRE family protein [Streptomyces sp. CHD11]MBT3151235.1 SMP-30/gluconolactonase/LRE family protein [Streptomyces sp. CHD11]
MTRKHPQSSPVSPPSRRAVLGGAAAFAVAAGAGTARAGGHRPAWPAEFPLPDGWLPEGIAIGRAPYAYMGSRADGAILRTDLRTGASRVLHQGTAGLVSIGLKLDHDGLLYVAGGAGGTARLVDARTGRLRRTYRLTDGANPFVNDVALVRDRAWFTDSRDAVLYGVPRGRGGRVRELPLGGDWEQVPDVINANGIVSTPDGRGVIVVNSTAGELYRVSLRTGHATRVALAGAPDVVNGDGLVRVGRTLYVVQNRLNLVTVFDLDGRATTAALRRSITDPRFDVPATAARFRDRLYLVNARFTSPQTPETTFTAVAVPL